MANYRPKSLDELNNFYDKKLSSENVIEDTASTISTEAFVEEPIYYSQTIDDFFAEQIALSKCAAADLTEDINRFIANFGKPATAEDEIAIRRRPVVPIKIRNAPTPPKPVRFSAEPEEPAVQQEEPAAKAEPAPEAEAKPVIVTPPVQETKPEKTEFVITAEKNELFEEYMRIMSDEDDDSYFSKSKSSRRRKKSKKSADPEVHNSKTSEKASENIPDDTVIAESTPPKTEAEEETDSFVSFTEDTEKGAADSAAPEIVTAGKEADRVDLPFVEDEEDYDENDSDDDEKKPRKNVVLQLILFLLLFITLLTAFAVTAVKTTMEVNTGKPFADKYYLYTADFTDEVTAISKGDLIVIENVPVEDGNVFAYNTPGGIAYAVQTFSAEPERTTGKNSTSDKITVMNTAIQGKVTVYESMGKLVLTLTDNFMTIVAALLVFAVFIILLLIFAFRHKPKKSRKSSKDNFSFDEQEDIDEASDEDFSLT